MHNENMSDTLYHFVGGWTMSNPEIAAEDKDEKCYEWLKEVLKSKYIAARDFDNKRQYKVGSVQLQINKKGHLKNGDFDGFLVKGNITCYCEIPLTACVRHCRKYGKFGVGFPVEYMASRGARPVIYMPCTSQSHLGAHGTALIDTLNERLKAFFEVSENEPDESVLELLRRVIEKDYVAFIKPFNCSLALDDPVNYYTEREWRLLGSTEITPKTVRHIVVAAGYKERLIRDLPEFASYEIREIDDVSRPRARSIGHIKQVLLSWYKKYLCTRAAL